MQCGCSWPTACWAASSAALPGRHLVGRSRRLSTCRLMLEAERLSYWFPSRASTPVEPKGMEAPPIERAALKEISVRFQPGEFVLVVGTSGCGKSTFIQALLGVVPALTGGTVAGRVRLDGEEVLARGLAGVAGKVGLVLQDPESQLTNLDVEGEVVFGPENPGLRRQA